MNDLTTERWKRKRIAILKRDGYTDQVILRATGRHVPADTVHHIFPRAQYPEYIWSDWNLISVADSTHKELHTFSDELSKKGMLLLKRTALERGIKIESRVLIVGEPGTGKTTWAKQNLHGGLAYDLDYIAGAFRLQAPHAEYNAAAVKMANDLFKGFIQSVSRYAERVIIIRTAPTLAEVELVDPDIIVFCQTNYIARYVADADLSGIRERLAEIPGWAADNNVPLLKV